MAKSSMLAVRRSQFPVARKLGYRWNLLGQIERTVNREGRTVNSEPQTHSTIWKPVARSAFMAWVSCWSRTST